MKAKKKPKLTEAQERLMKELSTEWEDISGFSPRFHTVANTIKALKKRGLVETRVAPEFRGLYLGETWQEQIRRVQPASA